MRHKLLILVSMCSLLFILACEQDILKPGVYTPGNANRQPLFDRAQLISSNGSFTVGYRNYNIRPNQVKLNWQISNDSDFLSYKLFRNNQLIRTFYDKSQISCTDTLLVPNTYYAYSIATQVRSGLSKTDTLTVKTASNAAPQLRYRVTAANKVKLQWTDPSDIPGFFRVFKDNALLTTVQEVLTPDHVYNYTDNSVLQGAIYSYSVQKFGQVDSTSVCPVQNIYVNYVLNPPVLTAAQQLSFSQQVRLTWTENSTGETGFRIYRRHSEDTNFMLLATVSQVNATEYTDENNLLYDNTYHYYVTAIDTEEPGISETAPSNILSVTLQESAPNSVFYNFEDQNLASFFSWGNAPWMISSGGFNSNYCVSSGSIPHGQNSDMRTQFNDIPYGATVYVEFDYKVDSEQSCDFLGFYVYGNWYEYAWNQWSGQIPWTHRSAQFTCYDNTITIMWYYEKDGSINVGQDRAWVDNISISYVHNGKRVYLTSGGTK